MDNLKISISGAGHCAATLTAQLLGRLPKPDADEPKQIESMEKLRLAGREGMRHEQFIKEDLPEHGWFSVSKDSTSDNYCKECKRYGVHVEYTLPNLEAVQFVGHLDDLVYPFDNKGSIRVAEYKALGRFTTQSLVKRGVEAHRTYHTQISLYHYAVELPIFYVIKNRDTGEMNVREDLEPISIEDLTDRFTYIEDCVRLDDIGECDYDAENMIDKYYCTELCDA